MHNFVRVCPLLLLRLAAQLLERLAPASLCHHHSHTTQNYSIRVVDEVRTWIAGQIVLQLAFSPSQCPHMGLHCHCLLVRMN